MSYIRRHKVDYKPNIQSYGALLNCKNLQFNLLRLGHITATQMHGFFSENSSWSFSGLARYLISGFHVTQSLTRG